MSSTEKSGSHSGATGWEALMPLDWDRLRQFSNEPVPMHLKRWWFSLGGTPAYLFLIQITTGLLLTFYYQPGGEGAYESVERITNSIPFGWFIRSIHKWSAYLMIVALILHVLRVFFTRAYRHPRQLNWVFGVLLLGMTLSLGFTGYSLVYEQLSYWGATVAANLTESVPLIGPPMATLLRGGPEVGPQTMTRLFLLHVGILPAMMIGILGLHLTFVRLHGVTEYEFERKDHVGGAARVMPIVFAGLSGLGAILMFWGAATGMTFDFVGYHLLPRSSLLVFLILGGGLAAGAFGLLRRSLAGYYVFLTAVMLVLAKIVRDLLLSEAPNPGLWKVGLVAFGGLLFLAVASHNRFRDSGKPDEGKHFNFFPDHALTELMIGTGLLFLLTLLTLLFPAGMGEKANPLVTPEHIKPEWFFYFQFRLLKVSPGMMGLTSLEVSVVLTGLILAILILWPWIDRLLERIAPGRNLPVYVGIVGFLWFLMFTVWEAMVP
jgi:quinol-cytochrome oxidoreductase complex cytochrome b subunit